MGTFDHSMKCLNCYSEYIPTLLYPICEQCGFCYYCRRFLSCIHYKEDLSNMLKKCPQGQSLRLPGRGYKDLTCGERKWDSYTELSLSLISRSPYDCFAAVLVIDESTRRGLGKSNMLVLLSKLQAMQYPQNCYIEIVPTGSSDIDIIRIVDSYKAIPVFLLTSDKELYNRVLPKAILVKSKGTSNAVRIIFNAIRYRIKRL
jgi:hypothetical protein